MGVAKKNQGFSLRVSVVRGLATQGSLFSKLLQFFLSTAIITMLQYYSCFFSIFKRLQLPPRPTVFDKNINTPKFSFKWIYICKCSIFKLNLVLVCKKFPFIQSSKKKELKNCYRMAKLPTSNLLDLKRGYHGDKKQYPSLVGIRLKQEICIYISEQDCSTWILKVRMSNISNIFMGFLIVGEKGRLSNS